MLLAAAASVGLSAAVAQAGDAKEVNFGIISTESTQNLKSTWLPFLEAMEENTGLKVNAFFAPDYAGIIEGMRFDKVHVAWFGNKSAMEAVDRAGGQIFAQTVDVDGNPGYWSLLITHKDSGINNLDDVLACTKELNFGIGDPNSTSGFLVPTTFIFAANDVDPKDCFKTVRNANHETNAMAVANKQVHIAANNTENIRRLAETNPDAYANIKEIWRSPLIPSDPLVWREDLDQDLKDKIYTFVMTYGRLGTPEEVAQARQVLAALQWAPFRPSSDAQLYPIRQMQLNKELTKVMDDDRLEQSEKDEKIADLNRKIQEVAVLADTLPRQ
ncbi:MAG: phosphonate ABC transporter substrate-binding protein [Pseudomonadota bacterium]